MTGTELQEDSMTEASVNFGTGVSNAWSNVATFIPKFIVFLIILIAGYFIAKALAKLAARILTRLGFDQLAERPPIRVVPPPEQPAHARSRPSPSPAR